MANKGKQRQAIGTPVKDLFKDAIQKTTGLNNISAEQIKQAFAIIDAHTKFLDQLTIMNNMNSTVQIIADLVISLREQWFGKENSEELFMNLCNQYFDVFVDNDKHDPNSEIQKNVREFIINNCMVYYAVHSMSKEMLKKYNAKVNECVSNILNFSKKPMPVKKEENNTGTNVAHEENKDKDNKEV